MKDMCFSWLLQSNCLLKVAIDAKIEVHRIIMTSEND